MDAALDRLQRMFLQVFAKPGNSDPDNRLILEWYIEEYDRLLREQEALNKVERKP